MPASPFELEVRRVAAREGIAAPNVLVSDKVSGTAATVASGRRIRLDSRVLEWPEPAQRWIAAHEVYHAMAHGWREPGRWLTFLATVLAVGVGGWAAWLGGPGTGLITLIGAGLLMVAGTSWWTRRLEEQADRYAASDGRLDALDADSLLELFVGETSVPPWWSTHPRWTTRFPVGSDRLPDSLRQLQAGVDIAYADLTAATGRRWRTPVVDLVRRLPHARTATGRWPRTVVVARDALTLPPPQLQPRLRAAIIAAHRLPKARAAVAVFLGWVGLLATFAYAMNAQPARTGTLAVLCGIALCCTAVYERWRRRTDRHLANPSRPAPDPKRQR